MMADPTSNEPPRFRDRLLAAEPVTPAFRERYEREMNALIERQLKPAEKTLIGGTAALSLGIGVWLLFLAATQVGLPGLARGGLLAGALFSGAWCFGAVHVLRRGTARPRTDEAAIAAWSWVWGVLLTTLFLMLAPRLPGSQGVLLVLTGVAFLLFGAVSLILARVRQSETDTRLKLLEIELGLAELRQDLLKR